MAGITTADEKLLRVIKNNRQRIIIGIIGPPGAGKSSLINTLHHVMYVDEEAAPKKYNEIVRTAPDSHQGPHTTRRTMVVLSTEIRITDNRGWHDWEDETAIKELVAQIEGHRRLTKKVMWEEAAKVQHDTADSPITFTDNPITFTDKTNCVAVVISGRGGLSALKGSDVLFQACDGILGQTPVIVATHKDEMSDADVTKLTSEICSELQIEPGRLFFVQNVTNSKPALNSATRTVLLQFLECCINDGKVGEEFLRIGQEEIEKIKERKMQIKIKNDELLHKAKKESRAQKKIEREEEIEDKELAVKDVAVSVALEEETRAKETTETARKLNKLRIDGRLNAKEHYEKFRQKRMDEWTPLQREEIAAKERAEKYKADLEFQSRGSDPQ